MVILNTNPSSLTPDIDGLEREQTKVTLKQWFLENYEDPAENTPYVGEVGYQWIWGGPYDAREEIVTHFTDVPRDIVEEVVTELQRDVVEWAPNSNRIYDEETPSRRIQP